MSDLPPTDAPPLDLGPESNPDEPKRRRRRSKSQDKEIRELNLTAMMDMMTIVLVFLLSNFGANPRNVQMGEDLQPPRSTSVKPMEVAVTVTITKKVILVDDKPVAHVEGDWTISEEANTQPPQQISVVQQALEDKVTMMNLIADRGGPQFDGRILIVSDSQVPYALLMRVLYTAGQAKFGEYKLVVRAIPKEDAPAE